MVKHLLPAHAESRCFFIRQPLYFYRIVSANESDRSNVVIEQSL